MNDTERQEKLLEYQLLANQLQQIQNHLASLEQHISKLQSLQQSLTQLATVTESRTALVPLGSGIFLKGTIDNTNEVIMNVGANICVSKPANEALDAVAHQLTEVQDVIKNLENEMQKGAARAEALRTELQPAESAS